MLLVHGTCVDLDGRGILLRGPSGSGKSDLALRLIDGGARLVADDQVELYRDGRRVLARAPLALSGRIEIRGLGIVPLPYVSEAPLRAVVDLVAPHAGERVPDPRRAALLDIELPAVSLAPFEASAVAKLRRFADLAAPPPTAAEAP
jgi:serine kinase of HPr protein (carbohydrate metabolism regulator)